MNYYKKETNRTSLYDGFSFDELTDYDLINGRIGYGYRAETEYAKAMGQIVSRGDLYATSSLPRLKNRDYYHREVLGSTVLTTGRTGRMVESYAYDAFGSNYEGALWGSNKIGYNGKVFDPVVGLANYGFRDYAPAMARFTTIDPIQAGNNWYAYCSNDPVNFIDPLGLCKNDTEKSQDGIWHTSASYFLESLTKTAVSKGKIEMTITDRVIKLILNDKEFKSFENDLIRSIMNGDIGTGYKDTKSIMLGGIAYPEIVGSGLKGLIEEYNKSVDYYLKTGDKTTYRLTNELFYMLRNVTFSYSVTINEDNSFQIQYSFRDYFDLKPHWGDPAFSDSYNRNIEKLGKIWHEKLGISDQALHRGSWTSNFDSSGSFLGFNNLYK